MARVAAVVSSNELRRINILEAAKKLPYGEFVIRVREAARVIFYSIYSGKLDGFDRDVLSVAVAQDVEYMLGVVPDTTIAEELWMVICDGLRKGTGPRVTVEDALRRVSGMQSDVRKYQKAVLAHIS